MKKKFWIIGIIALLFAVAVAGIAAQNATGEDTGNEPAGEKSEEVISAEGFLIGRIDSHSVEIEVEGKLQAFSLSDELRDKAFARGEISFKYYADKYGRLIITEADFQELVEREVKTAEGIMNGMADNHTVEITIENMPRAFGLDDNISFAGFAEGEAVFINYYEDESGRQVIIKVEKII